MKQATKICLALTEKSLSEDLALLEANRRHIDLVELRADFLDPLEMARMAGFPRLAGIPAILAIRRRSDGGRFAGSEGERIALLEKAIAGGWSFVDLEEDLIAPSLEAAAARFEVRVIRSFHDFTGVPAGLVARTRRLARNPGELPKATVMPRSTGELLALLDACAELSGIEKIVLGMGDWGFPTRVLAGRLGSYLTYSTAGREQAAPGHVDPRALEELYRVRSISDQTRLFCIIGNPVMHTRSPLIHNTGYKVAGLDACYLPIQVDDPALFFAVADRLGIAGASVTIPHKESVLPMLAERDPFVARIGSCNTLVRLTAGGSATEAPTGGASGAAAAVPRRGGIGRPTSDATAASGRWRGANTDAPGFLAPLARVAGRRLSGKQALVVGAGGAARAVVAALVDAGCAVAIVNRTVERARRLAAEFGCRAEELSAEGLARAAAAIGASASTAPFDLIIQTTSAGMHPNEGEDPIAFYELRGSEIVYDLVYAPRETLLLARAVKAGCRTIGGFEMLLEQAYLQFKLFTGLDFPEGAKRALTG